MASTVAPPAPSQGPESIYSERGSRRPPALGHFVVLFIFSFFSFFILLHLFFRVPHPLSASPQRVPFPREDIAGGAGLRRGCAGPRGGASSEHPREAPAPRSRGPPGGPHRLAPAPTLRPEFSDSRGLRA